MQPKFVLILLKLQFFLTIKEYGLRADLVNFSLFFKKYLSKFDKLFEHVVPSTVKAEIAFLRQFKMQKTRRKKKRFKSLKRKNQKLKQKIFQFQQNLAFLFPTVIAPILPKFTHMRLYASWTLNHYLQMLVKTFFGIKLNWLLYDVENLLQRQRFLEMTHRLYKRYKLQGLWCRKHIFDIWFLKFFYFKDPVGVIQHMIKWIMFSYIKRHRSIFQSIHYILRLFYYYLSKIRKIKGFSMFIKGKLGKKGSVRKSKFYKKYGEVSYSTKQLRLNYRTFQVFTPTGALGGNVSLFF